MLVVRGTYDLTRLGTLQILHDGVTSIGIGKQETCGAQDGGDTCPDGDRELDRGSCTAQTLFGEPYYQACGSQSSITYANPYPSCPFITLENKGPRTGDIWCRVARVHHDGLHLCKTGPHLLGEGFTPAHTTEIPSGTVPEIPYGAVAAPPAGSAPPSWSRARPPKSPPPPSPPPSSQDFCHVITIRAGPRSGTYLRVDDHVDSNQSPVPANQSALFGGPHVPEMDLRFVAEAQFFDWEMDEVCTEELHWQLMDKYVEQFPPPPPPPPPNTDPVERQKPPLETDPCHRNVPFIHSFGPGQSIHENKLGSFNGSQGFIEHRGALYEGEWTFSLVIATDELAAWTRYQLLQDGKRDEWHGGIHSSVGFGEQFECGREKTGSSPISAETLFGNHWFSCHQAGVAPTSNERCAAPGHCRTANCPFIVAEGHGPHPDDVWCRVSGISNDAAHHCKHDPTKYCHVITVRAGVVNGTYLRVDERTPDRDNGTLPSRTHGFFGGDKPLIDMNYISEFVAFNWELSDECTDHVHNSLLAKHVGQSDSGYAPSPPPPPDAGDNSASCAGHRPYVHSYAPDINSNKDGVYAGDAINSRGALFNGQWTIAMVIASDEWATWNHRQFMTNGYSHPTTRKGSSPEYDNMHSSIGVGRQMWCGYYEDGDRCNSGGAHELDRGSCTQQELFGADYFRTCGTSNYYNNCPYIVAEGSGPNYGDTWCAVASYTNDAMHLCKHDPSKNCHVITFRVGLSNGTYLRVDENSPSRNVNSLPDSRASFWGGSRPPSFDADSMHELMMWDFEMGETCTDHFHQELQAKHIVSHTAAGVNFSPPPPPHRWVEGAHEAVKESSEVCAGHVPWIHSYAPTVAVNTGGSYNGTGSGTPFVNRAALHHGEWTIFLVLTTDDLMSFRTRGLLTDASGRSHWGNIESRIGVGPQNYCGYHRTSCDGAEADRGSCSAQALWPDVDYYQCSDYHYGQSCPWITVEGAGPAYRDVWCRTAPFFDDAAHVCKDDPSKFCHVVSFRVGLRNGTYLRVDESPPDRSRAPLPQRQASFFGGAAPFLDTPRVGEFVAYNWELTDTCLDELHLSLMAKWIAPAPSGMAPSPPPPPPLQPDLVTRPESCGAAYIHTFAPAIYENRGGTWPGKSIENHMAALPRGEWTVVFVIAGSDFNHVKAKTFVSSSRGTANPWGNMGSSVGIGARDWCGRRDTGNSCDGNEVDRGWRCSKQNLFGGTADSSSLSHQDDFGGYYFCGSQGGYAGQAGGGYCPFIVAEGAGPRRQDLWCRVLPLHNDGTHHCAHDLTKFCHVVTVRVGKRQGSYMRVDEQAPDRSRNTLQERQAAWFGGRAPFIESQNVIEFMAYNYEMNDNCTNYAHERLMQKYLSSVATPGVGEGYETYPPPPPIALHSTTPFCTLANANYPDPVLQEGALTDSDYCCSETCRWAQDGQCDDGGEGSFYDACAFGTDCIDCGGPAARCVARMPIPWQPYIHTRQPNVHYNVNGRFRGSDIRSRVALYAGPWTVSFVIEHDTATFNGKAFWIRDGRTAESNGNIESSIGIVRPAQILVLHQHLLPLVPHSSPTRPPLVQLIQFGCKLNLEHAVSSRGLEHSQHHELTQTDAHLLPCCRAHNSAVARGSTHTRAGARMETRR